MYVCIHTMCMYSAAYMPVCGWGSPFIWNDREGGGVVTLGGGGGTFDNSCELHHSLPHSSYQKCGCHMIVMCLLYGCHVIAVQPSWLKKWKLHGSMKSTKKNKNCNQLISAYKVRVKVQAEVARTLSGHFHNTPSISL